jgi:hypothetical protein
MNIGVDAAALGMANAVTASTSDELKLEPCRANAFSIHLIVLMYRYHFANIAQYDYICKSH